MDHQEAAREQLVERYLLGELTSPLADEFEAHLFECPQCSEGLRAAAILQDNARTAFRAEVNRPPGALAARRTAGGKAPGIRSWLPAWIGAGPAAPALAALALLAVVSYQNLVQIPRLSTELEAAAIHRRVFAATCRKWLAGHGNRRPSGGVRGSRSGSRHAREGESHVSVA